MIGFVEKLQEVDTTGVEPLRHMSFEINKLRNDEVKGSVSRAEALQNAGNHTDEFFMVPKVIDLQFDAKIYFPILGFEQEAHLK